MGLPVLTYEMAREALKNEGLPAALVDLDAFDRNAAEVERLASGARPGGIKVRIATKSLRVPDLMTRLLSRGAPYAGLMCRTAEEAAFLAGRGFDDLLVAYPTLRRPDLDLLAGLHRAGKRAALVVDSAEGLASLDAALRGAPAPFPFIVEVDASARAVGGLLHFGALRSPIRDVPALRALLEGSAKLRSVSFGGLMAYESFEASFADKNPFRRALSVAVRLARGLTRRVVERKRREFSETVRSRGLSKGIFNGGGTGSLPFAVREGWLTEVTAGSAFLCPHLLDYHSQLAFEPACYFALQATRAPSPGIVTCHGGGLVGSGAPGADKLPRPWLPEGGRLLANEGCGEVQTPVRLPPGAVALGDPVLFRHAKAGELAEHFGEYLLLSRGRLAGRAQTYRGLGFRSS
jgi:D-serine deaminase-like pyridoxal phosphate-dependent protein